MVKEPTLVDHNLFGSLSSLPLDKIFPKPELKTLDSSSCTIDFKVVLVHRSEKIAYFTHITVPSIQKFKQVLVTNMISRLQDLIPSLQLIVQSQQYKH